MSRRFMPILAVMVSVVGCSDSAPPTLPTTPSTLMTPAGTWSGSISDPISGAGTVHLSLSDIGSNAMRGTWSATFKNGSALSGPAVAGLIESAGYGIVLYGDPPPPCESPMRPVDTTLLSFTLLDVVITSGQLTGATARLSCSGTSFGAINLSKK